MRCIIGAISIICNVDHGEYNTAQLNRSAFLYDDVFSKIPLEKGFLFAFYLETLFGMIPIEVECMQLIFLIRQGPSATLREVLTVTRVSLLA